MNLSNVTIVLAHPEESRNIGSVCRAMANADISDLRIVGNRGDYNEEQIRILAIHAVAIWENARFFDTITAATADCTLAAGTTRRRGKKRKGKLLLPEEFAELAAQITDAGNGSRAVSQCTAASERIGNSECVAASRTVPASERPPRAAIVFGNERTGLTDEELDECTLGVTIPSSENFASLNLSHAVQIICYELFRQSKPHYTGYTPLPLSRIDKTVATITDNLQQIGFFKITGKPDMEKFWRGILSRAAISESEAQYIEKIFTKAAGLASSKKTTN